MKMKKMDMEEKGEPKLSRKATQKEEGAEKMKMKTKKNKKK